jgi:hypothetical protein
MQSDMNSEQKSTEANTTAEAFELPLTTDHESFLTGWELYRVGIGLSVSYFLIMLNATIIVTVSDRRYW